MSTPHASFRTAGFIALASLRRGSRSTAALLIFILSLSFVNLMFVSGILTGLTHGIIQTLIDTYTSDISIEQQSLPLPKLPYIADQSDLRAELAAIPGVTATARHYNLPATISYDKNKNGVLTYVSAPVVGIDPADEERVTTISQTMVAGSYLDGTEDDQIVLGAGIAGGYNLPEAADLGGVHVGDKVTVTYTNGVTRTYTVKGIFLVLLGSVANQAFVTAREAESVLSVSNSASEVLVRVNTNQVPLATVEGDVIRAAPGLKVRTYEDLLSLIAPILDAFNLISYIVTLISIIVASITLFVLIYINALAKLRQIGVLRAIGIDADIIVWSYVMQSLFFVLCGILLGSALVFFALQPFFIAHPLVLPIGRVSLVFTPSRVWLGIVSLFAAGIIGGWLPARLIVREAILKAIWG